MEKAFTETLEELIEAFLKFFYGFLHTNWCMIRHPKITAERLVRQSTFDAFEFTLPYTYFALSFLLNFLLLRTLFKILYDGKKIVEAFLPTLVETLSGSFRIDPLTAFGLMVVKAIPLFGVMMLGCYILVKRLRLTETLRHSATQVFCYCFGFFWNNLTLCLLALLVFANIWASYRGQLDSDRLIITLYGLLGTVTLLAAFICYRFARQAFQALLSQDVTSEITALSPQALAIGLFIASVALGLVVEYGMTLLDVPLLTTT